MFDQASDACSVSDELPAIFGASRISIPSIESEIKALRKGVEDTKIEIQMIESEMHKSKYSERTQEQTRKSLESLKLFVNSWKYFS